MIFALAYTNPCGAGGTEELWQSDDAGATWHQAGSLPGMDVQSLLVSSQGAGALPLLYAFVPGISAILPSDLKVSSDGGITWHAAPVQGIPTDANVLPASVYTLAGPMGALSDGSVLAGFMGTARTPPYLALTLFRWKPGEAAWHQVSPAAIGSPQYVLVIGQPEVIWLVIADEAGGFTAQRLQPNG
jgi:hypothetical protein